MKSGIIITLLLSTAINSFSQQIHPFSEEKVEVDGWVFMPWSKGEVEKRNDGLQNPALEQIWSVLTAWDSIDPPQGVLVICHSSERCLEMRFTPYIFQDGERIAQGSGPTLTIYADDPDKIFGNSIAPGIFLRPEKTGDFYGYPVYSNDIRKVTIVSDREVPLFVPVTREEYLKAAIAEEEEKERSRNPQTRDQKEQLEEVDKAYRELLKVDKAAAEEFRREMAGFTGPGNDQAQLMSQSLKNELAGMTAEERRQPAYYGGGMAMEMYSSPSGLTPWESRENAVALVRPNPELTDSNANQNIQLLILAWKMGPGPDEDSPGDYSEGRTGFSLADNLMFRLYQDRNIWNRIFSLADR